MESIVRIGFFIFCLIICSSVEGQEQSELQSKKKQILQQITITNSILQETKKNQKATLDEYRTLESQIGSRSRLINAIQGEIENTSGDITDKRELILHLNKEVEKLKEDYAQVLRSALRQKLSRNIMLYILSSKSLKQALLRWRYTHQFQLYAKQKALLIQDKLIAVDSALIKIEKSRNLKKGLLSDEQVQNDFLRQELRNKNDLLKALQRDEKRILDDLKNQNEANLELERTIAGIIVEDNSENKVDIAAAPEPAPVAEGPFDEQRGNLSWPVQNGFITQGFGRQQHPSLRNITTSNNGIDIRSGLSSKVYAVFDGEVSGQASIPGFNNMIVIKHGDFRTVYARIDQIYVKKGEKVRKGQLIGNLAINDNKSELHFEIWNGEKKLDPEKWLNENH